MLIFFDAQMDLEFGMFSSVETQKPNFKIYPIIYTGIIIASLVEKILELAYELVQISLKSGFRIF